MQLEVINISKSFNRNVVLKKVSFNLQNGEIGCLIGASGSGKTTILRSIAGLESIDSGEIKINNRVVSSKNLYMEPSNRNIGFVFQDYGIIPHMTVKENILFTRKETEKLSEILRILEIEDIKDRYPHEISGGQQQRVAVARALYGEPELLLMDEPFSNLDVNLRGKVATEIRNIIKRLGLTALIVTHNIEEAFLLGDKVGVINNGHIEQWASPYSIYHRPATPYVANFAGEATFIEIAKLEGIIDNELLSSIKEGNFSSKTLMIRPEDIILDENSHLVGETVSKEFKGPIINYMIKIQNNILLKASLPSNYNFYIGEKLKISIKLKHIVVFDS